jgi:hypothetical protein
MQRPRQPRQLLGAGLSLLWDVHPVAWTQAATDAGQRVRLTSHQTVEALFDEGDLVSAGSDGPVNTDSGISGRGCNCPPMFVAPA